MRVFLTGGTGYLGDWIARELMHSDHRVVVLARNPMTATSLVGLGAEVVQGDLLEEHTWKPHLGKVDAVIHAAALVKPWGPPPEQFDAVNIQATETILRAATQYGLSKIVVTGSLFSLGPSSPERLMHENALAHPPDPLCKSNHYTRSKAISSRRVFERQRQGSPVIQVFPTILVGPGVSSPGSSMSGMITKFNRGRLPGLVGSGKQVWNFVGVSDAARGHILALEKGRSGENYILGGENWTQRRFFEFVAMELNKKPLRRPLGKRFPMFVSQVAEALATLTGREPFLTQGEVLLSHESWAFSGEKSRKELGFNPEPLEDVLRETIAWLRDEIWPKDAQ